MFPIIYPNTTSPNNLIELIVLMIAVLISLVIFIITTWWFLIDNYTKQTYCIIENGLGFFNVGIIHTIFNIQLKTEIIKSNDWGGYHVKIEYAQNQLNEILREEKSKEIKRIIENKK